MLDQQALAACGVTRRLDGGAVRQSVVLAAVVAVEGAQEGLWFEHALGPAVGCSYPVRERNSHIDLKCHQCHA